VTYLLLLTENETELRLEKLPAEGQEPNLEIAHSAGTGGIVECRRQLYRASYVTSADPSLMVKPGQFWLTEVAICGEDFRVYGA
jgi:hypothetical protein